MVEFTAEVASWSPGGVRRRGAAAAAPGPDRGGGELPVRLPGRRRPSTTLAELGGGRLRRRRRCRWSPTAPSPSSSTLIRHAVAEGDFGRVRELSDQPFRFTGVVVRGDQRGRELGFPTANVAVAPGMAVPADGVYAGWVTRLDGPITRAGRRPSRWAPTRPSTGSSAGSRRTCLDRDDLELYGVEIAIDFYARLRGQVKYAGRRGADHEPDARRLSSSTPPRRPQPSGAH